MKLGVINIPYKVGPAAWEKCWTETADRAEVFGVNESFTKAQRRLYLRLAKEAGYGQYGTRVTPNPVFWDRSKWRRVEASVYEIHGRGPLFRLFPGFNESRYVTEVVLRHRRRQREIVVLNTHWVPEGRKVTAAFRDKARAESKAMVARLMRKHVAAGREVFLVGDLNIHASFVLPVLGFRWARAVGVDKVGVAVPLDREVVRAEADTFPAPTDHKHGVVATIRTRRKES